MADGLRSATPDQAAYYRDAMLARSRRRALRALGVALVQAADECPDDLISGRETELITGYRATRTRIVNTIGGDAA